MVRLLLRRLCGGSFGSRKTAGDVCLRHKISSCGAGDTLQCLQDSSFFQKYTLFPYGFSSRSAGDTCDHFWNSSRRGDDKCVWCHNSKFGADDTCCRHSGTNFCAGDTFFQTTSRKPGPPGSLPGLRDSASGSQEHGLQRIEDNAQRSLARLAQEAERLQQQANAARSGLSALGGGEAPRETSSNPTPASQGDVTLSS